MKAVLSSQLFAFAWLFNLTSAFAQPVVETYDRFELNWSTMRIRFYGEAAVGSGERAFDTAEKTATEDGLHYALGNLVKVRQKKGVDTITIDASDASKTAVDLTKQAYIVNTTYFDNSRIRVDLEGQMSKAFEFAATQDAFRLEEPEAKPTDATAIVVLVKDAEVPQLTQAIVASSGETLYSAGSVSRSAFRKNMLGRWFYQNSIELKNFSGKSPLVLEAQVAEGNLVVSKDQWNEAMQQHARLIEEAKVAFVLPSQAKGRAGL